MLRLLPFLGFAILGVSLLKSCDKMAATAHAVDEISSGMLLVNVLFGGAIMLVGWGAATSRSARYVSFALIAGFLLVNAFNIYTRWYFKTHLPDAIENDRAIDDAMLDRVMPTKAAVVAFALATVDFAKPVRSYEDVGRGDPAVYGTKAIDHRSVDVALSVKPETFGAACRKALITIKVRKDGGTMVSRTLERQHRQASHLVCDPRVSRLRA